MKSTSQLLTEAKAVIQKPENWTQGTYARDIYGKYIPVNAPEACSWCALGAISLVAVENGEFDRARQALEQVERYFTVFNDNHTHAEVLAMFDKAIASLSAVLSQDGEQA